MKVFLFMTFKKNVLIKHGLTDIPVYMFLWILLLSLNLFTNLIVHYISEDVFLQLFTCTRYMLQTIFLNFLRIIETVNLT